MDGQPLQSVPSVINCGREAVLRSQPVVERDHRALPQQAELAAQHIVGIEPADGKAAAMEIQQSRQSLRAVRRVKPCRHEMAVAGGNMQGLNLVDRRRRQVQQGSTRLVEGPRLVHTHRVHGRTTRTVDVVDQSPNFGRQR